jgi:hypothetical protein
VRSVAGIGGAPFADAGQRPGHYFGMCGRIDKFDHATCSFADYLVVENKYCPEWRLALIFEGTAGEIDGHVKVGLVRVRRLPALPRVGH